MAPINHKIKTSVQFPERSAVPKEQSQNALFDVFIEDTKTNASYCKALIQKKLTLPYAQLPDFIDHHCKLVTDPIKWINKFEKLIADNEVLFEDSHCNSRMMKCYTIIESKRKEIEVLKKQNKNQRPPMQYINAENDERYFSFREVKSKVNSMANYTDKIMFLTKEKFEYEQASIEVINPKLPDFSDQCQREIDQIQHLIRLTDEFSKQQLQQNTSGIPYTKLKINCNINQLVDIFYQLHRELFTDGKPIIDGNVNDIIAIITNSFVDKDGRGLSPQTIKTMLAPSKGEKRPKPHKRIDIDKLL